MERTRLPHTDKEQRLRTAELLLKQAQRNGGTAKELAAFLRVSPATVSHWKSCDGAQRRRVAAPTDAQLSKLVGYIWWLVEKNLEGLQDLARGYRLRSRERSLFLCAMDEAFTKQAQWWSEERKATQQGLEDLVAKARELYEEKGAAGLPVEMLRSLYNLSGIPEPEDLESGEVNFDRLCPPADWIEQFCKTAKLSVEYFMAEREEQRARDAGLRLDPTAPEAEDPAE
jgi:hypothetical protein